MNKKYKIIRDERNHHKEIYNVGDNSLNYSIREISEIISKLTSIDDIEIGEKDSDQRSYFLNFDKKFQNMARMQKL